MPNGFAGVMSAVSGVFFAYIGFDALSVLSEETKDPQKTLPKGMIISCIMYCDLYCTNACIDRNGRLQEV
jgi:amino acid transporter